MRSCKLVDFVDAYCRNVGSFGLSKYSFEFRYGPLVLGSEYCPEVTRIEKHLVLFPQLIEQSESFFLSQFARSRKVENRGHFSEHYPFAFCFDNQPRTFRDAQVLANLVRNRRLSPSRHDLASHGKSKASPSNQRF